MVRLSAERIRKSTVAARLRLTRQALKLSQIDLCRITRISPQAWNNAETGDNLIGIANAVRLCHATGGLDLPRRALEFAKVDCQEDRACNESE